MSRDKYYFQLRMNYMRRSQPTIRLMPQQPFSNSRLAVYVTSADNIPIKFFVSWYRHNHQANFRQQIKNHQGTFYECSPLDFGCIIEVVVQYESSQGTKAFQTLSFPIIKLNYQLQERQLYVLEPTAAKFQIDEIIVDATVIAKKQCLSIISGFRQFDIPIYEGSIDIKYNTLGFNIRIDSKMPDFILFLAQVIGWTPKLRSKTCEFVFQNRVDRDLILLSLFEDKRQSTSSMKSSNSRTPRKDILNTSSQRINKDKSLSANKTKDGKIKISSRVGKKNMHSNMLKDQSPYDEEFQPIESKHISDRGHNEPVSMDLRESFAFLETDNTHKNTQEEGDSMFIPSRADSKGDPRIDIKLYQENFMLKEENSKLRQELENMNVLAKENITLKKKYMNLAEEINRLETQRRQILEDKLRFQSNYCRELQEKQYLKKQVQSLRQMLQVPNRDKSLSPYNKPYDRPVTPDRNRDKPRDLKSSNVVPQQDKFHRV